MTFAIVPPKDKYRAPPTHIRDHFPADTFYPHQEDTLYKIEREVLSGKKYIFLEAPTGAGKSFMAVALAKWMNSWRPQVGEHDGVIPGRGAHLLTIQKILQDQYQNDFPSPEMETLKGRSNYPCDYEGVSDKELNKVLGITTADIAPCKIRGEGFFDECIEAEICQYAKAVEAAQVGDLVNFNFQSWLFNTVYTDRFEDRLRLLVLDEAHNVESQLMSFVSYTISDRDMPWHLPSDLTTAPEYITWLHKNSYLAQLEAKVQSAKANGKVKALNVWQNKLRGFKSVARKVEDEAFIAEELQKDSSGNLSVELKPLYVRRYFPRYFDADVVFFMSATILNAKLVAGSLGLDVDEISFIRMPSTFPVAHRPIYVRPVGPMTFKHVKHTTPRMIEAVNYHMEHYEGQRGIIHCHSFKLGDQIYDGLNEANKKRIVYQKDPKIASARDPRMEVLKILAERPDGVILAPAFHEGIDLKDDLSRFALICKVPYPDIRSSKQLAARTDTKQGGDFRYYMWLTALKMVQSVGRTVRSPTDWAHTYILDQDFIKFVDRTRSMLPEWFTEAITYHQN